MNSKHNGTRWLLALLCVPCGMVSAAGATVDTSDWTCEYCVVEKGYSGEVDGGVGWVSDDSYKFGEYNGLEDSGGYLVGNARVRYRDGKAGYLDLRVRDIGLDTRSVDISGGRQGSYSLSLDYQGIPHNISNTGSSPYLGIGGTSLTLPTPWTHAGTTSGMNYLGSSLHGVDLETMRKRVGVGATFIPASRWETSINVRHEDRDGQLRTAGTFLFNSAELVAPVDYKTDEVEAAATYTANRWQMRLAYYGSFFNDHNNGLTWENAYNPMVAGADKGQLSLPPDNRFNQFQFAAGYQVNDRTRVSGNLAVGRMEQDDALLPATLNPNLSVSTTPTSANARVDTVTGNLQLNSRVTEKFRVNAYLRYNDRNNKTPSQVYDWVSTDTSTALPRNNLPYSFTDKIAKVDGDYRLNRRISLSAGAEYAHKDRTNQEVDSNREETGWGKISLRLRESLQASVRWAHSERDASGFHLVSGIVPAENPLMTKYNLADRSRDNGSLMLSWTPLERVSIGLSADLIRDRYTKSLLGLTASREGSINGDISVLLTDATSLHAFGGRDEILSEQAGSQSFTVADWTAENFDVVNTFGIGAKHQLIKNRLDIGADYVFAYSRGEVKLNPGSPGGVFPDLTSRRDTVKVYADYRLKQNLSLNATYWYEHYHYRDWMVDGVYANTIPNVIALGTGTPGYVVNAVTLSLRYKF